MKKRFLLLLMVSCSCLMWGQTKTIETLDDLVALSTNNATENGYAGQTIELNSDLTITKPWRPIGTAAQPFQGTFKGNGHVISGLGAVSRTDGVGLFGYVGSTGTIQELGIGTGHIKTMKNDVCQNIGSLVGHNAGKIVRCWNMATIEANGTNVGGLVGQNAGTIEDCYNAGPVLKATDLIGGLVGTNTGIINRCYNIGFARNGYGLAEKSTGTITEAYYDGQLYVQIPEPYQHFDPEGVIAVERTTTMFSLFASSEQWTNSDDNYPILTVFKDHDAAKVSVASANVDPFYASTENHMNALVSLFNVNTANGISWNTTSEEQANWVFPTGGNEWGISSPCRPTECILTVSKGSHVREVYAFPLPVYPFDPGIMLVDTLTTCVDDTIYFHKIEYDVYGDPTGGAGDYKMLVIATRFDFDGDSIKNDTILDAGWDEYYELFWHGYWIPKEPGVYKIRRYAADSQCHLDYAEAIGFVPVIAPDTIKPGDINAAASDSLCYADSVITISSNEAAVCPETKISYYWTVNGEEIEGAKTADLEYTLPEPGTYSFLRYAYNDKCTPKEEAKEAPTEYKVTLLDEFKKGEISSPKEFFVCDTADVITTVGTITADTVTGGDNKIGYQWYMIKDETTAAIEGATEPNLTLSDVAEQLSFEFDKTYSFFRMVNDTMCQTTPISSKDTVVVTVYPEFKEGDITAADDSLCWEEDLKITINSAADATFGSLDVYYYWTVQYANGDEDSIKEASAASLTDYAEFNATGTYTFRRYVYNVLCVERENAIMDSSEYKVTVLDEFKQGEISSPKEFFVCDTADVITTVGTINATAATGGDNKIGYQWYMIAGSTTTPIEGATEQNLTLSDVAEQLSFEFDKTYSFFRMVNDTMCQTTPISSKDTVVVTVYPEFKEGDIPAEDDSICSEGNHKITISSVTDAAFGSLDVYYYWTVQYANGDEDSIKGANAASLTDYAEFNATGTYTFRRYVYNVLCVKREDAIKASSEYKVTLLEEFKPGSIASDSIRVCTVEEALEQISAIQGNPATGGDGTYVYKWNMCEEGTTDMIPDSIADEKDLDLTKVTLQQGFKYTFYREAKDDFCETEWKRSDNTFIIEIFGAVTAGEIENKTIDSTCMIASLTKQFDVVIGSVKDATTPKGDIVYTWYMTVNNGEAQVVGNDTTLTYTIKTENITGPATYTFYRTAMNRNCDSEQVRDAGQTTVQVSLAQTIDDEIVICESKFIDGKYDYYYPSAKSPHCIVTFDLNNKEPISFSDYVASPTCPPYVTLTPVIIPSPAISTDNEAEICQDGEDGTITLFFKMEKGAADMYSIELSEGLRPYFNNEPYINGDLDNPVHEGERGSITLQCSRIGALGEKIMYLQVGTKSEEVGQETCFSTPKAIQLHITQGGYILSKYDKVLFIDNNPKTDLDHKFIDYQWYKNGAAIEGAKGQYYSEGGEILHGSYFADLTYLENGLPIVIRTCTMEMPIETARKLPLPTENVSKQLEDGRIFIQRGEAKYDILGNKISSL